jgi:hypothetical protein
MDDVQADLGSRKKRIVVVLGIVVASVIVVGGAGWWWWNSHWPPRVYDRELSRIGPPVPGARALGRSYTTAGNVICLDECLVQGQSYAATGNVSFLAKEASNHLKALGYRELGAFATCEEYGPPTLRVGNYSIGCVVSGQSAQFSVNVTIWVRSSTPLVVVPRNGFGQYNLGSVPAGLRLNPHGGDILVEITK